MIALPGVPTHSMCIVRESLRIAFVWTSSKYLWQSCMHMRTWNLWKLSEPLGDSFAKDKTLQGRGEVMGWETNVEVSLR